MLILLRILRFPGGFCVEKIFSMMNLIIDITYAFGILRPEVGGLGLGSSRSSTYRLNSKGGTKEPCGVPLWTAMAGTPWEGMMTCLTTSAFTSGLTLLFLG